MMGKARVTEVAPDHYCISIYVSEFLWRESVRSDGTRETAPRACTGNVTLEEVIDFMYTLREDDHTMIRTVEAVIDEHGNVRLLEPVHLPGTRRALVMILEEYPATGLSESALLSEAALAEDWNRPEEDKAWAHLQQVR